MASTSGSGAANGLSQGRVNVVRGINPIGGTLIAGGRKELTTGMSEAANQTVNVRRAPETAVPYPSAKIGQVMNQGMWGVTDRTRVTHRGLGLALTKPLGSSVPLSKNRPELLQQPTKIGRPAGTIDPLLAPFRVADMLSKPNKNVRRGFLLLPPDSKPRVPLNLVRPGWEKQCPNPIRLVRRRGANDRLTMRRRAVREPTERNPPKNRSDPIPLHPGLRTLLAALTNRMVNVRIERRSIPKLGTLDSRSIIRRINKGLRVFLAELP